MRVAAPVSSDGQTVTTLVDASEIVIWESDHPEREQRFPNPSVGATRQRRLAVTNFLVRERVHAVITVPESFCATSQRTAQKAEILFLPVEPGTSLHHVQSEWKVYEPLLATRVPLGWLHT
ncbi:MAG: hypothetical protein IMX00_07295 [Limnochordales bacterium]|nr:hypothetical protein [Limnochordales bacterium]